MDYEKDTRGYVDKHSKIHYTYTHFYGNCKKETLVYLINLDKSITVYPTTVCCYLCLHIPLSETTEGTDMSHLY